jgi:hypothetical protein
MYQFIREASDEYFKRMALYTWDQFLRISILVSENSLSLGNVCADMLDHLWYLGDVFQSSIAPYIEDKLRNVLMQNAVEPFLKDDVRIFKIIIISILILYIYILTTQSIEHTISC